MLVLTPTRELADQVQASIQQLAGQTTIRSATVYGGVGMAPQERALRNGTEIIVACPGRLLDHAMRGTVDFRGVECLVVDEADRMLDMGFLPAIRRIIGLLPRERQTMLFAATFPAELNRFVAQTLRDPARIAMGIDAPAETVTHAIYPVPTALKTALLTALLRGITSESVLIFTRTKHRADRVAAAPDARRIPGWGTCMPTVRRRNGNARWRIFAREPSPISSPPTSPRAASTFRPSRTSSISISRIRPTPISTALDERDERVRTRRGLYAGDP